jgi:CHAT domain-containing protein/tetratricopeptide (TPR) repeat protein
MMLYKKNTASDVTPLEPSLPPATLTRIFNVLIWAGVILFFPTPIAAAQSDQTIHSEAQLASRLCGNLTSETTDELLNKNGHLVNVSLWSALVDCASSTQSQGSPAKSIELYKVIFRVADRLNKPELFATTYYHLGRTYSGVNDLGNAIHACETSRKLFEQTGNEHGVSDVLAELGGLYLAAEDYEKAQSYSEQSLAIAAQIQSTFIQPLLPPIEYGKARSLLTLGQIDLHHANHDDAIRKLNEALALYERLNGNSSTYNIQIADVFIGLAKVYGEMGKYADAFSYLTKADHVSNTSQDENTRANIISSQASLLLEQEDYGTAQKYFRASLAIYRSVDNSRQEASVLLNLAMIEERQGNHDGALRHFRQTLEHAVLAKLVDVQIAAREGLGVVLTAKRDYANALQALNQSLELARRVNAKTREAELLWRVAQTQYAMQNYRESGVLAEQALTLARSRGLTKLSYLATATLGEAYAADNRVEIATTTLKDAINLVEKMRDEVVGLQEGRHLFFENKVGPYRTLVKLLTNQGQNFEALLYAERAKGRVLLETVRNNGTDLKGIFTDGEKAEAECLMNRLHAVNQLIKSQAGGGEQDPELQQELKSVRSELVSFQEKLAAAHPELLLRFGPARSLTQESLKKLLPANDLAYLEYIVTDDKVGIFILKRNTFTDDPELKYVNLTASADEVRRKVAEFHSAVAQRDPGYDPLGRELYRLLIAPVANELQDSRTVCIIPDEFLWTLPFQALTTRRGNYFVQEYSLYYAPSLTVLNEMTLRRRQQSSNESLIAFGNPVIENDDELNRNLHPLPEAEAEVAGVARAVRSPVKKVFVGAHAEEKVFKDLAPQYATIHIATHGVLNNREPLNSYLLLTRTDGDAENDGLLQAREIMDLHLDADLAVLSACETGNGRISPGEGVVGMSWAFLVAGTRSVVVSQWRVNSASTSRFMRSFYEALARQNASIGRNKSQALREASLNLLKDRRYRHPFYWAGFVLVSGN